MWQRFCAIINTLQCMMQCNSQVQSKGTIHRLQSVICPLLLAVQCSSSLHPLSYSHNLTDIPLLVDPSCLAHICTIPGAQCAVTIIKKKIKTVLSHNNFNATHTINFDLCIGISLGNSSTLSPTNADCAHIKKVWGRQTKQGNAPYIMQATVRSSAGSGWISLILLLDSQLW